MSCSLMLVVIACVKCFLRGATRRGYLGQSGPEPLLARHNPRVAPERCLKPPADLHDMGKQNASFVAVWFNYRFQGQQIPQLEEDD